MSNIGNGSAKSLDAAIAEARGKAVINAAEGEYPATYTVNIIRNEAGRAGVRWDGSIEGPTSITEQTAYHILIRMVGLSSRCALGDGLDRETVARLLEDEACAIRTQDVAEDMSPILFHHA